VMFDELQKGIFRLRHTSNWYPHVGTIDRATYDVTLRSPKKFELLASGRVVESKVEAGQLVEHRKLELPSIAFSFEVGAFEVVHARVGHVDLTVAISKTTIFKGTRAKTDVLEAVKEMLPFYEKTYGAYPLDYLTVVSVPRGFSQGYLGFVTLSQLLLVEGSGFYFLGEISPRDLTAENRRETIAHELAHQWWGNKVGWHSYRDQWLSEALADFSAVTFMANASDKKSLYLARHASGWRSSLSRSTTDGRSIESIGPVVLGNRLASSKSTRARSAIMYDKGSLVFSMLARVLREDAMVEMLGSLADTVANRVIDTETFVKSLERMSGADLSWFADQYIYGTSIPEVFGCSGACEDIP
jgi:aminopeptidase N